MRRVDGLVRAGVIGVTVVAGLAMHGMDARAADDVEAILKRGTELRRQNRDREALAEFQRAARIQDTPRVDAQMALAEQALGLWLEAHTHLSHALERGNDAWIRKNRAALDQALATIHTHLSLVEIWGEPAGAEVQVDGKIVGKLPQVTLWLTAGGAPLQVTADGHVTLSKTLTVSEAARIREHVALRPVTQPLATTAAPASPTPVGARAPQLTAPSPTDTGAATLIAKPGEAGVTPADAGDNVAGGDVPAYRKWWFWTLVGVLVAAGGATAWVVTHRGGSGGPCTGACSTWGTNP